MSVPVRISMGSGVRMRKERKGGVMRCRFAASAKKGKTSSTLRGSQRVVRSSYMTLLSAAAAEGMRGSVRAQRGGGAEWRGG